MAVVTSNYAFQAIVLLCYTLAANLYILSNMTSENIDYDLTPPYQLLQILARPFSAQPAAPRPSAHPPPSKQSAPAAASAISSSSKAANVVKKNALVAAGMLPSSLEIVDGA